MDHPLLVQMSCAYKRCTWHNVMIKKERLNVRFTVSEYTPENQTNTTNVSSLKSSYIHYHVHIYIIIIWKWKIVDSSCILLNCHIQANLHYEWASEKSQSHQETLPLNWRWDRRKTRLARRMNWRNPYTLVRIGFLQTRNCRITIGLSRYNFSI